MRALILAVLSLTVVNAADWYVSASGSDGNSCASVGSPCLTVNGAYHKASNGDTIHVAPSLSYGDQILTAHSNTDYIYVVATGGSGSVKFNDWIENGAAYLDFTDLDTGSYNLWGSSHHIIHRNCNFTVWFGVTGGHDVSWIGGSIGDLHNTHPQIAPAAGWGSNGVNFTFDGVLFHDVTRDADQHVECLQVAGTTNLVIRNSRFTNCAVFDLSLTNYNGAGKVINPLIENNYFAPATSGGFYSVNIQAFDGGIFRFNSLGQAAVIQGAGDLENEGLIQIHANAGAEVLISEAGSATIEYRYNVSPDGTNDPTDLQADPDFIDPGAMDYSVPADSPAVGYVPPSIPFPATDIEGNERVAGQNHTAGAFEFPSAPPVIQTTVRLRKDTTRYVIASANTSTPVQVTFKTAPGWPVGTEIFCQGVSGNYAINGYHKVASASGVNVTLKDWDGTTDTVGYSGTMNGANPIDQTEKGYCGVVETVTIADFPRGVLAPADSALRTRLFGPGGAGSGTSTFPTDDSVAYNWLTTNANNWSTATCDGETDALCTAELAQMNAMSQTLLQGDVITQVVMKWAVSGGARYLNSARYYFNNIHRIGSVRDSSSGAVVTAAGAGQGSNSALPNDYWVFYIAGWTRAYALIRNEIPEAERTLFGKKVWAGMDSTNSCTNPADAPHGEINVAEGGTAVVGVGTNFTTEFAADPVTGRRPGIAIMSLVKTLKMSDSTLTNVVVSGTTLTITTPVQNNVSSSGGQVLVSNSGVSGLDGWWPLTSNGETFNLTATVSGVAGGTYTDPDMTVQVSSVAYPAPQWFRVLSVTDDTHLTIGGGATSLAYPTVNSPYVKIRAWQDGDCGFMWTASHHQNSAPLMGNHRRVQISAVYAKDATEIQINPATINNLRGLATPFYIESLKSEVMQVTNVNYSTNRLTVVRQALNTPLSVQTSASEPLFYRRWIRAMSSAEGDLASVFAGDPSENLTYTRVMNYIAVASDLLEDAPNGTAGPFLEYAWNWFIDIELPRMRSHWTGQTPGGGNAGYHGGRYWDFGGNTVLVGKNSFNPPIDVATGWTCAASAWWPYFSLPYASFTGANLAPYGHVFSDAGNSFGMEEDDSKIMYVNNHLCAGTDDQRMGWYWQKFISQWANNQQSGPKLELLPYRIAYTPSSTPDWNYTTNGPRYRAFVETETGGDGNGYSMLHGRSSWSLADNPMSVWLLAPNNPQDHIGNYPGVGELTLWGTNTAASGNRVKGTPLICSGAQSCIPHTDIRLTSNVSMSSTVPNIAIGAAENVQQVMTVYINAPAGADGAVVELSSNSAVFAVPATVVVPAGQQSATFTAFGYNPGVAGGVGNSTITGTGTNSSPAYMTLSGNFECTQNGTTCTGAVLGTVASVTFPDGATFTSGGQIRGRVTLTGAAGSGGRVVNLSSDNPAIIVPASLRVRQNKTFIDFPISAAPGTSPQSATITANSVGSAGQVTASAVSNLPADATVSLIAPVLQGQGLTACPGCLNGIKAETKVTRHMVDPQFLYARVDGTKAFAATTASGKYLQEHINFSAGGSAHMYHIVYDSILPSGNGYARRLQIPYYRGRGDSGGTEVIRTENVPTRSGNTVTYVKPYNQVMVTSKILVPTDTTKIYDGFANLPANQWGAFLYVNGGQDTARTEFLQVHRPHAGTTDTVPAMTLITSDSGHRVAQIDDPDNKLVAGFAIDNAQDYDSITYTTTYSGTAKHIQTSVRPSATYTVTVGGSPVAGSPFSSNAQGVLTFNAGPGATVVTLSGTTAPLSIDTLSPLPGGATGQAYNQTLSCSGGVPPYTWAVTSGAFQTGLSLGSSTGILSGTPSVASTVTPTVRCSDSVGTTPATKVLSLTVVTPASPVSISTTSLAGCTVGDTYDQSVSASGGVVPYTWSLDTGSSLPPGFSQNTSTGRITGTCTTPGTYTFTVKVTDSLSPTPQEDTQELEVEIAAGTLTITPDSGQITNAIVGTPYMFDFEAQGGTAPFTWEISGQPAGLTINSSTGTITGTPTKVGSFPGVIVTITDSESPTPQSKQVAVNMLVISNTNTLETAVVSQGTAAILTFRHAGLDAKSTCEFLVLDNSSNVVQSGSIAPGYAVRVLPLTATLSAGTQYSYSTTCGSLVSSGTFTPASVTGTRNIMINLPGQGVGDATIRFGLDPTMGSSTSPVSCPAATGCVVTLPDAPRGQLIYLGWQYGGGPVSPPIPYIP